MFRLESLKLIMVCFYHMGEKKIFASQGALNNQILKKFAQKGHKRLYFTQLFVPISNFALEVVDFELAVQGIKRSLDWCIMQF